MGLAINHFFGESGRAEEVVATSIPPIATAYMRSHHMNTSLPILPTGGKPLPAPDPWKKLGDIAQAVLANHSLAGGKKDDDASE